MANNIGKEVKMVQLIFSLRVSELYGRMWKKNVEWLYSINRKKQIDMQVNALCVLNSDK